MIETQLAGANFRPESARQVVKQLQIGDTLDLVRDPHNAYDAFAVQVHSGGVFIGFIAKADNEAIADHLDNGGDVTVEVTGFFSTFKPTISVELL